MILVQCDATNGADEANAKERLDFVESMDSPFCSESSDQLIIGDPFLADEVKIVGRTTKYHRMVVVDPGVCAGIGAIWQKT